MPKVTIYENVCKGCALCTIVCPKKLLAIRSDVLNAKGYRPVGITDEEACIACASCAKMCPDSAIEIEK
ncbi:MAG: ferredoxin family protein [Clostridia bacterium]|nr:ferredoxin family protein [Clostridia bacterium]